MSEIEAPDDIGIVEQIIASAELLRGRERIVHDIPPCVDLPHIFNADLHAVFLRHRQQFLVKGDRIVEPLFFVSVKPPGLYRVDHHDLHAEQSGTFKRAGEERQTVFAVDIDRSAERRVCLVKNYALFFRPRP